MRKVLACLLLLLLPVTPTWAGVALDCGSGTAIAAADASPAAHDESDAAHECCASDVTRDVQCGAECTNCHGLGLTALVGSPSPVGVIAALPGDSTHACRLAAPLPSQPLRPPAALLT